MELIQKYVGASAGSPKINKLSGTEWRQTKAKAKMAIANMAKDLLEMQAQRKMNAGHKFGPDTVWQKEFEEAFPFEETADQLRCIEEIKRDMESSAAMDRLLCGDVGYGKTEVAARAMFKAVSEGVRSFDLLAIAANTKAWPCGACRQVLNEFAPDLRILITWDCHVEEKKLAELLPEGFGPQSMQS